MDKELTNKELEEVSGGMRVIQLDEPKPQPQPLPSPFSFPELICGMRNEGTKACFLFDKGKLIQCSDCSKNHD